jgi:predicted O-methyltransferase YrrM
MSLIRRTVAPVVQHIDRRIDRRVEKRLAQRDRPVGRAERTERELRDELADTRKELRELRQRLTGTELLLGPEGRRMPRRPTRQQIGALARRIAEVTGEPTAATRRETVQAYRTLVEVENRGVGRIAGGTGNIIAKLATTPLLGPPNGAILEIGTLFGLFAGCLARQIVRAGLPYHLTIVDPVSPVQLQKGKELGRDLSGTPITEDVIRANLHYAGVEPDRLRLIPGYSTDPELQAALASGGGSGSGKFGVIVVDGDHSREGVAADLRWVEGLAAPGAVVVLDDYGDAKWPGVKAAADAHLAHQDPTSPSRLTMLGQVATSAFLRAA